MKLRTCDELLEEAFNEHLKKIDNFMYEAVFEGKLFIYYEFPKIFLEDNIYRDKLGEAFDKAGYSFSIYQNYKKVVILKINCIEIIGEEKTFAGLETEKE